MLTLSQWWSLFRGPKSLYSLLALPATSCVLLSPKWYPEFHGCRDYRKLRQWQILRCLPLQYWYCTHLRTLARLNTSSLCSFVKPTSNGCTPKLCPFSWAFRNLPQWGDLIVSKECWNCEFAPSTDVQDSKFHLNSVGIFRSLSPLNWQG